MQRHGLSKLSYDGTISMPNRPWTGASIAYTLLNKRSPQITEYETASLAISQAQLAIMQAQVSAQNISTVVTAAVSAAIGLGQIGLIGYGLRRMRIASEQRDRQLDQQDEVLAQQHSEVLAHHSEVLARQNEVLAQQNEALAAVLRRTE